MKQVGLRGRIRALKAGDAALDLCVLTLQSTEWIDGVLEALPSPPGYEASLVGGSNA